MIAKCRFCPGKMTKQCVYCKRCLVHPHHTDGRTCICVRCRVCSKQFPPKDMCPKCKRCPEHHAAGSYIGADFPMRTCSYSAPPKTTYILNPLQRTLGVEVEASSLGDWESPPTKILSYTEEHDGSVKPSQKEFVLSPAGGDRFQKGLTEFLRLLHAADVKMNSTCGYHVHVDGADLRYVDLRRIMALFKIYQNEVFHSLIANSRASNVYCAPVKYSPGALLGLFKYTKNSEVKEWFHQELYGMSVEASADLNTRQYINQQLAARKAHKYENVARRQALNFHSWMMRGTVEFRCKEGTMDQGDFLLWPLWCGWFVEAGNRLKDSEVVGWLQAPSSAPSLLAFTQRFMPPVVQNWVAHRLKEPAPEPEQYNDPEAPPAPRRASVMERETRALQEQMAQRAALQRATQTLRPAGISAGYNLDSASAIFGRGL